MSTTRSTASARPPASADGRADPGAGGRDDRGGGTDPGAGDGAERWAAGTALVGTLVGFAIFLALLLLAVEVSVRLYDTSVLTSAATEAAEQVAQTPDAGVSTAEAVTRSRLGGLHARFVWKEVDGEQVVLEVVAPSPRFVPVLPGWGPIKRTVTVRTERFR